MILGDKSFVTSLGLALEKDNELPLRELFWAPSGRQVGRHAEVMRFWAGVTQILLLSPASSPVLLTLSAASPLSADRGPLGTWYLPLALSSWLCSTVQARCLDSLGGHFP